jgi:hypothetical protein
VCVYMCMEEITNNNNNDKKSYEKISFIYVIRIVIGVGA